MATLDDITVPTNSWVSANTLSGVAVGTALEIQSKGDFVLCLNRATQPSASDNNGVVLVPFEMYVVDAGEPTTWLKAVNKSTPVSVQEGA